MLPLTMSFLYSLSFRSTQELFLRAIWYSTPTGAFFSAGLKLYSELSCVE